MKINRLIIFSFLVIILSTSARSNQIHYNEEPTVVLVTSNSDSGNGSLREALATAEAGTIIRFSEGVFPRNAPEKWKGDSKIFYISNYRNLAEGCFILVSARIYIIKFNCIIKELKGGNF